MAALGLANIAFLQTLSWNWYENGKCKRLYCLYC